MQFGKAGTCNANIIIEKLENTIVTLDLRHKPNESAVIASSKRNNPN